MRLLSPSRDHSVPRTIVAALLFILAVVVGTWLRTPDLDLRPVHTDEAVHGIKLGELLEEGRFTYDPKEYHGPTLPYAGLVACWLTGKQEVTDVTRVTFRSVAVVFGILLILLLPLVSDGIGRVGVGMAAVFTAVSPMMVYFSRYYIMEILFVVFAFGLIACGWRYFVTRKAWWLIAAGVFLGLTHATKETCVITFFAMGVGVAATSAVDFFSRGSGIDVVNRRRKIRLSPPKVFVAAGLAAAAVSVLFFSSFFTNWAGVWDSVATYKYYFVRSGGSGHEHPWWYYLKLLVWKRDAGVWSEGVILALAAAGGGFAFLAKPGRDETRQFVRFLSIYAAVTLVVYSAISYKTPWTIMGFHHAAIVLAGFGASRIYFSLRPKWTKVSAVALAAVAVAHLAAQAYRGSFVYPADIRNPYVYSHTSTNFEKLVGVIRKYQEFDPALDIRVAHPEWAWPMPWYLRDTPGTRYYDGLDPEAYEGDVIIVDTARFKEVDAAVGDSLRQHDFFGLRPDALVSLYVRPELWERFRAARDAERRDAADAGSGGGADAQKP